MANLFTYTQSDLHILDKPTIAVAQALWEANKTPNADLRWMQGIHDLTWMNKVFAADDQYREDHSNCDQRKVLWTNEIFEWSELVFGPDKRWLAPNHTFLIHKPADTIPSRRIKSDYRSSTIGPIKDTWGDLAQEDIRINHKVKEVYCQRKTVNHETFHALLTIW